MAQPPKGGLVRGHDKPIHGSCAIYFPGGIQNMSRYKTNQHTPRPSLEGCKPSHFWACSSTLTRPTLGASSLGLGETKHQDPPNALSIWFLQNKITEHFTYHLYTWHFFMYSLYFLLFSLLHCFASFCCRRSRSSGIRSPEGSTQLDAPGGLRAPNVNIEICSPQQCHHLQEGIECLSNHLVVTCNNHRQECNAGEL